MTRETDHTVIDSLAAHSVAELERRQIKRKADEAAEKRRRDQINTRNTIVIALIVGGLLLLASVIALVRWW